MADIQQYLDQIAKAEAGEDVRWSIHDSIEKINQDVVIATNTANASKTAAENAATIAEQAAAEANTAAGSVENATWLANLFQLMPNRRRFNRYRNLGQSMTLEQYQGIQAGDFKDIDLCVGDYWEQSELRMIVADINYYDRFRNDINNKLIYPSIDVLDMVGFDSKWLADGRTKKMGYADCILLHEGDFRTKVIRRFEQFGFSKGRCSKTLKLCQSQASSGINISDYLWLPTVFQIWGCQMPSLGSSVAGSGVTTANGQLLFSYPYTPDGIQWALTKNDFYRIFDVRTTNFWLREICAFNNDNKVGSGYVCGSANAIYTVDINSSQVIRAYATIA